MIRTPVARRRAIAIALAVLLAVLLVVLLAGGGGDEPADDQPDIPEPTTTAEAPLDPAREQLIDRVLLVGFEGSDPDSEGVRALGEHRFGGILIGPGNWSGADPGAKLIEAITEQAGEDGGPRPLIATAQEAGPYRALIDLPPEQRAIEVGDRADEEYAEEWSREAADALAEVGVELNLAPVADVATLDSGIADRAFSDDAGVAAAMTAAALAGCQKGGIACAPSHFPGEGSATLDTTQGPSSVALDASTLARRDLVPFEAAFDAGAPAVVVSAAIFTAYDPVTPATLAEPVATGLLREELGFEGVAISEDVGIGAIGAGTSPGDAAVDALAAGIDLVQIANPGDVEPARRAIRAALSDGSLSEERLTEAAERVLELKRSLGRPEAQSGGTTEADPRTGE